MSFLKATLENTAHFLESWSFMIPNIQLFIDFENTFFTL